MNSYNYKGLRHNFTLLSNLSRNAKIRNKIVGQDWHIKYYESLKETEPDSAKVLKEIDSDILTLAVDFLKSVCIGSTKAEEDLARILIKDMRLFEQKKDEYYMKNVFIPLVNAESEIPICLHPYDPETKSIITDTRKLKLTTESTETKITDSLKSELMTPEQVQNFAGRIEEYTK